MAPDSGTPQPAPRALRTWLDRLLEWLLVVIRPVANVLGVLWLAGWCTVLFVVGAVFFLVNDQGRDFLRRLTEANGWESVVSNVFFFLGVLAWGLSTWYCARLLYTRRFPLMDEKFFESTKGLRTWLPRAGASLVAFVVAGGFLRATPPEGSALLAYALCAGYAALGVVFLWAMWKRREMFGAKLERRADVVRESLPKASWRVLQVSFALSWGLLVLFLLFPVGIAGVIGAPAILLFAAASWILFGSMVLTYWPLANRYPTLTLPLVGAALLMSLWNDNHTIRSTEVAANPAPRQPAGEHFRGWLDARLAGAPAEQPYPVFVVAAAGGGIRAAYWTASVLGRIADESGDAWPDHLYALSGVSGGSMGVALHAAQIADLRASGTEQRRASRRSFVEGVRHSLDNDILSPALSYFLFPDLVQRFAPIPFSFADRARAIELAMEAAVADPRGAASARFSRAFVELWPAGAPYATPALLLNGTVVETGQRGVVSNIRLGEDVFPDVVDLLHDAKRTQGMPLSTAVHLSARFTYISPAGTIRTPRGDVWGHVVDGGYFENSGAATATELMRQMRRVARRMQNEKEPRVALMLILIRNDPAAPSVCERDRDIESTWRPDNYLSDLLSPLRALLSTRVARGRLAEEGAVDLIRTSRSLEGSVQSEGCRYGCVFEFNLHVGQVDPPLGWSLSARSRQAMDEQLDAQRRKFECIEGLLTAKGCESVPRCEART